MLSISVSAVFADNFCLQQGDAITFSWHFVGIGKERCFHDGVELPECESPMRVTANDVSSADTTHTFQVKFVDVCGEKKTVDYKYTQRVRPDASAVFVTLHTGWLSPNALSVFVTVHAGWLIAVVRLSLHFVVGSAEVMTQPRTVFQYTGLSTLSACSALWHLVH
jgi:hypothetical protein